ncbi:MAG: hypothetical protein WBE76_26185 [Terracidiphilus sp.]
MKDCPTHGACTPRHRAGIVSTLLLISALAGPLASAQPAEKPIERTSVVVFADRAMQPEQWATLFAALRLGVAGGGRETQPLDQNADFVRGDEVVPGFQVQSAITVFLHGDCTLSPQAYRTAFAVPLGWVRRVDGRIEPFVHVDCTRIAEVLGPQAMWMNKERRTQAMAEAMSRVILHEWIHIATQNAGHAERGIAKAEFGVADLLAGIPPIYMPHTGQ